jgi:hypothetical protein
VSRLGRCLLMMPQRLPQFFHEQLVLASIDVQESQSWFTYLSQRTRNAAVFTYPPEVDSHKDDDDEWK